MASRKATILDVARLAGVSRTTVSRVLNEPDRVPPATVQQVRRAVEQLNYSPSPAARTLRNGRTGTLALLVGDISQPFHGGLARAISREAESRGMSVMLYDLGHSEDRLRQAVGRLPQQGVDGVILATADPLEDPETLMALNALEDHRIPLITTLPRPEIRSSIALNVDHAAEGMLATRRLLEAGSSDITLLVNSDYSPLAAALIAGASVELSGQGAKPTVVKSSYDFDEALEVAGHWLDGRDLDATHGVVAATVPMALGLIRAAETRRLAIPNDLMVIACEEVSLAGMAYPPITTVAVDADTNGAEILLLLTEAFSGVSSRAPIITPVLRERGTVREPVKVLAAPSAVA
ncbi:LacI family DNA-binding transcriptional regulator [Microbacterium sp. ZW CA_36]|uniref:LacI family DNA-binding transcriptional regulator n=1 Tax=Microbacterium sp. ZW CA_36 TaxID=3378078 RepID=UPI0038532F7D